MGDVHQLILREGLENARSMAETRTERQAVEAAGMVLADEVSRLGITHAGFAMTSLPHKRIEEPLWRRRSPGPSAACSNVITGPSQTSGSRWFGGTSKFVVDASERRLGRPTESPQRTLRVAAPPPRVPWCEGTKGAR